MVVIARAPISVITYWHDNAGLPSRCTVHAPHCPLPQPYFVPVSFKCSRKIHSNGVSGWALTSCLIPFTLSVALTVCVMLREARTVRGVVHLQHTREGYLRVTRLLSFYFPVSTHLKH